MHYYSQGKVFPHLTLIRSYLYFTFVGMNSFLTLKPGSHMPPTYLGHSYTVPARPGTLLRHICEHLSPNHNLSQVSQAFTPRLDYEVELSPTLQASWPLSAIVSNENILCGHHLRTQSTPGQVRQFDPHYRWNGWACSNSICIRANLSISTIHHRCVGTYQKWVADRCQLQPATT